MKRLILLLLLLILVVPPAWAQEPPPESNEGGGFRLPNPLNLVRQIVQHILIFPTQSMREAIEKMTTGIIIANVEAMASPLAETLLPLIISLPRIRDGNGGGTGIFAGLSVFEPTWRYTLIISFIFWPTILVLLAIFAARDAIVGKEWGVADALDVLVTWGTGAVLAFLSLYLMDLTNRAVNSIINAVMAEEVIKGGGGLADFVNYLLLSSAVPLLATNPATAPGFIFLVLFMVALGMALIFSLGFSFIARHSLLLIFVALAPMALSFGALPPLRWLRWLWLKGFVLLELIGLANALLLRLGLVMLTATVRAGQTGPAGSILRFLVALGILGVILSINGAVIRAVFGTIIAIAQEVMGVIKALVTAGIAVAGAAVAGGGGLAAPAALQTLAQGLRYGTGTIGQAAAGLLHGFSTRAAAAQKEETAAAQVQTTLSQAQEAAWKGQLGEAQRLLGRAEIEAKGNPALLSLIQKAKQELSNMPDIWTGNPKVDRYIAQALDMVRSAYPGITMEKEALEKAMWPVKAAAAYQSIETMAQQAGFVGPNAPAQFLAHRIEQNVVPPELYGGKFKPVVMPKVVSGKYFGVDPGFTNAPAYPDYEAGFDAAYWLGAPQLALDLTRVFHQVRTMVGFEESRELYYKALELRGKENALWHFNEYLRTTYSTKPLVNLGFWFNKTAQFGWNEPPARRREEDA